MALLNQINDQYQLLLSRSLLQQLVELYQLNPDVSKNQYLQATTYGKIITRTQINDSLGSSGPGLELPRTKGFPNGNASLSDVTTCLLSLLKNDAKNLTTILNNQFKSFRVIFKKINNLWTYQSFSELTT